ncbi:hypothetical protein KGMB02408_17510 [Bacteroides faecalis]|uniref:Uncharacterized protein n=1 Tax=Bacteroides faecalis TaxID=2447885 RepID=A0A401LTB9_9BACE|nr:hypothetical protein KGMB02408_17510 [Bacteroides faecalis]
MNTGIHIESAGLRGGWMIGYAALAGINYNTLIIVHVKARSLFLDITVGTSHRGTVEFGNLDVGREHEGGLTAMAGIAVGKTYAILVTATG